MLPFLPSGSRAHSLPASQLDAHPHDTNITSGYKLLSIYMCFVPQRKDTLHYACVLKGFLRMRRRACPPIPGAGTGACTERRMRLYYSMIYKYYYNN